MLTMNKKVKFSKNQFKNILCFIALGAIPATLIEWGIDFKDGKSLERLRFFLVISLIILILGLVFPKRY